ncbi:MAG: hypothetical protein WCK26_00505 [Candidatus Saccharibacteria bacterium]
MLGLNKCGRKGDTLIEVLFAITVFSLVAVGSISIMNQGTATAQRAYEITLVRQEIDAQAETLRFLNASYIAAFNSDISTDPALSKYTGPALEWVRLTADTYDPGNLPLKVNSVCPATHSGSGIKSFILNTRKAKFVSPLGNGVPIQAETFSQVTYNDIDGTFGKAYGIWIDAVKFKTDDYDDNYQDKADYIDFHIRACWDSPGQSVPVSMDTIVRLYEPKK